MPSNEDLLDSCVSWLNSWAMSGNFARLLGMFHADGRMHVSGAYGTFRLDSRQEIEAFFQQNKPADSLELTHTADTPIGALGTFRWSKQPEDAEAGNLTIELKNDQIIRFAWEFLPTTRHPIPFAQGGARPVAAAPAKPAATGWKPMTAGSSPLAARPAAPAAPEQPAPAATPSPAPSKPVFL